VYVSFSLTCLCHTFLWCWTFYISISYMIQYFSNLMSKDVFMPYGLHTSTVAPLALVCLNGKNALSISTLGCIWDHDSPCICTRRYNVFKWKWWFEHILLNPNFWDHSDLYKLATWSCRNWCFKLYLFVGSPYPGWYCCLCGIINFRVGKISSFQARGKF
jgi:hypothetical protein